MSQRVFGGVDGAARDGAYSLGAITMLGAAGVVGTALGFEYIGGIDPCPLCLQQRWAYYAAIPTAFLALVLLAADQRRVASLILFAISLAFLANAGLGAYHAGAEWKFWPGPSTCEGGAKPLTATAGGLLKNLEGIRITRCDEAAWRFAGLSFAGWNVITSLFLMITALRAAFAAGERN
jgi:disulfide bond formation protein DsbB